MQVWERRAEAAPSLLATAALPLASIQPQLVGLPGASVSSHSLTLPLVVHTHSPVHPSAPALSLKIVHRADSTHVSVEAPQADAEHLPWPAINAHRDWAAAQAGSEVYGARQEKEATDEHTAGISSTPAHGHHVQAWHSSTAQQPQQQESAVDSPAQRHPQTTTTQSPNIHLHSAIPDLASATKPRQSPALRSTAVGTESTHRPNSEPDSLAAILQRWGLQDAADSDSPSCHDPSAVLAKLQQSYDHMAMGDELEMSTALPAAVESFMPTPATHTISQHSRYDALGAEADSDAGGGDELDAILRRWGVSGGILDSPITSLGPSPPLHSRSATSPSSQQSKPLVQHDSQADAQKSQPWDAPDQELSAELSDIFAMLNARVDGLSIFPKAQGVDATAQLQKTVQLTQAAVAASAAATASATKAAADDSSGKSSVPAAVHGPKPTPPPAQASIQDSAADVHGAGVTTHGPEEAQLSAPDSLSDYDGREHGTQATAAQSLGTGAGAHTHTAPASQDQRRQHEDTKPGQSTRGSTGRQQQQQASAGPSRHDQERAHQVQAQDKQGQAHQQPSMHIEIDRALHVPWRMVGDWCAPLSHWPHIGSF